jgi:hypothetical protein
MSERRYDEDEVAEIFALASEAQVRSPSGGGKASEGLTLQELQEVGREVGLPPDLVAQAARTLDMAPQVHERKLLGLPVGVGRTVELARPLTDAEWHRVVADLRETFDARGRLSDQGPFKAWTNGNLQALLEPTATGQRLRLKTLKASAAGSINAGLAMTGVSAAILTVMYLRAVPFDANMLWTLFVIGIALLVSGALQVPGWASERERQMEAIVERVRLMAAGDPPPPTDLDR